MNKTDIIKSVAERANLPKKTSEAAVNTVLGVIAGALKNADTVQLSGFGSFSVKERSARVGKDPRTGEEIHISAKKNISFKPSKSLKNSL